MHTYSIGEAARLLGLTPSARRYYEQRGIVPAPPRVNGHRRYAHAALHAFAFLQFAQRAGFSLAEIRRVLRSGDRSHSFGDTWRAIVQRKLVELDVRIAQLHQMHQHVACSLACACHDLATCALVQHVFDESG